jgi:hypothetical protein
MTKRMATNLITTMLVALAIALVTVLSGCAGKGVQLDVETSGTPCGTKIVKFSTDYQVEQLEIGRTIEGGGTEGSGSEGCGGGYTVSLGKGTTKDAEFGVISELVKALLGAYGIPGLSAGTAGTPVAPGMAPSSQEVFNAGIREGRRIQTEEFNN